MTEILWTLAGIAWKSAVVLAFGAIAAFLLRRRPAAARHLVWTCTFASLLAIPIFTAALPQLKVPAPAAIQATETLIRTIVTGTTSPSQTATEAGSSRQKTAAVHRGGSSLDWRMALLAVLSVGCCISLLRMILNWMSLWSACRNAQPFPTHDVDRLHRYLDLRQPVEVRVTAGSAMPMVFGILHPAILLPREALQWPSERLRVVLLHEFAHVRRGDVATQWMARLALALYWWNPLVVHAWRAFLKEREHATDDLVLSVGEPAADYANHLLEIARGMQAAPVAAVAMARKSELEDRLMAILNSNLARAGSSRTTVAVALLLAAVATAPLASLRAQQDAPLPDVEALMRLAEASNNPEPLRAAIRTAERERRIDIAMALAEAALPLQARISGEGSVEFGQLLLKLGDLQRRRAKWENALTTYQKAVAILGERPETAHAITYFGIRALIKEDFTAAQEHLQKAQALNPENGAATMWMAMLRLKQNDPVEAESLFQSALARQPSESIEADTTMELYAHMLTANNRESEGKLLRERAEAIRKAAGAAPAPSPAGSVLKSGGNVTPPALAHKVEPVYTDEARAAKLQGTVIVYAEIGPNGQPHRLGILRGLGLGLDEQALDAIAQWRFKPGTKDGQPVNVAATIEVNFRLL